MERKCSRIKFRNLGYNSRGCPKIRKSEQLENSVLFGHSYSGPTDSETKLILFSFTQKPRDWNRSVFHSVAVNQKIPFQSAPNFFENDPNEAHPPPPPSSQVPTIFSGGGVMFSFWGRGNFDGESDLENR